MTRSSRCAALLGALATALAPAVGSAREKRLPAVVSQRVIRAHKVEFAPSFTYVGNDPWVRGYIPGGVLSYHVTESRALEVVAGYGIYWNKALVGKVQQQIDLPPHRISRPRTFALFNYVWSPLYGKMSFFGEVIVHHDFYFALGAGAAQAEVEQNRFNGPTAEPTFTTFLAPAVDAGIGEHLFLGRRFSLRVDLRPVLFIEPADQTPEGPYGETLNIDPNFDLHLTLSLSWLLF